LAGAAGLVKLPGRFQVVPIDGKVLILDVAHNDQALIAAAKTLESLSPRDENAMILGILRRKELNEFPGEIAARFRGIYLVEPVPGESHTAPQLLERIGLECIRNKALDVHLEQGTRGDDDIARLVRRMVAPSNPFQAVLITGSHRTVEVFGRAIHRLEAI
jgi:folylpolyglutamate synthase/dihydropteroate synthase